MCLVMWFVCFSKLRIVQWNPFISNSSLCTYNYMTWIVLIISMSIFPSPRNLICKWGIGSMTDLTGLTIILTIIIIIWSLKVLNDAREHVKLVICNNYIHNDNYTVCYYYLYTLKGRCLSLFGRTKYVV